MPDVPFYGGGGAIAHRLGMRPSWVLDLHNGGCAAGVGTQRGPSTDRIREGRTALIAIAQRRRPGLRPARCAPQGEAAVPGDGAAVRLVELWIGHRSSMWNVARTVITPVT